MITTSFEGAVFEKWEKFVIVGHASIVHVNSVHADSLACRERREHKTLTGITPLLVESRKKYLGRTCSAQPYTLSIKSVTSSTHLITRPTLPRWPYHSIGEYNYVVRTTHNGALSTDLNTLSSRPNYNGHTCWIAAHILQAEIRACSSYARHYT
jgi:hypothetical protein